MGSRSLLQGIFLTQGSDLSHLHCRWILYCLTIGATREALQRALIGKKNRHDRASDDGSCGCVVPKKRRRQWHATPVLLPGKPRGRRSLVGCSPWGCWESDTTGPLHFHALEKELAAHSSVLAWRIPETGSLVGCRLWGRTESDTTEVT